MDIESKEPTNDASCSFKDKSVELLLKTIQSLVRSALPSAVPCEGKARQPLAFSCLFSDEP